MPSYINQYRFILTQYHQVSTSINLYCFCLGTTDSCTVYPRSCFFISSQDTLWTIDTLYGLLGGGLALNSLGYFVYYLVDLRKEVKEGSLKMEEGRKLDMVKEEVTEASSAISLGARDRLLLVTLMTLFNFFFAGLEGTFKNLTPTFATASKLHLSRKQGADLSTIFFGTYTLNRWLHTNFRTEKISSTSGCFLLWAQCT